jgi:tetratricopeptide (TPR) repeat protein
MIREFRTRFPEELTFLQAECDLLARRGDFSGAIALTEEIDKVSKDATVGPILRARLFTAQGRTQDVARSYSEALERNPRQLDLRVLLGRTQLQLGEVDEALRQARLVLDVDRERQDAILLEARALSEAGATPNQRAQSLQAAADRLSRAVKEDPKFVDAYHSLAEIELRRQRRDAAVAVLQEDLKANPEDATAVAQLVQALAEPRAAGARPDPADLAQARDVVAGIVGRDTRGSMILAAAVGYHKAGQLDEARPLAEKAASLLDTPVAHLNYGDLLLSIAETTADLAQAKPVFQQAVEQYDRVL